MNTLDKAVEDLATAATASHTQPEDVFADFKTVLHLASEADPSTCNRLLQRLANIIEQTDGLRASALALGCGALVEQGGDPQIAIASILKHLPQMLADSTAFYKRCEALATAQPVNDDSLKDEDSDSELEPVEQFGDRVSQEMPQESIAWLWLEQLCLGAIAMLSRSPEARRSARNNQELFSHAFELAEAHGTASFLAQILQVLDDEVLLVLHPELARGYRVQISGIAGNFQLHTLLADALIGDPDLGLLPGNRPDSYVVAAAKDRPVHPEFTTAPGYFNLWTWAGLQPNGRLREGYQNCDYWIWGEGIPADIPFFDGIRIVLLGPPPYTRTWTAQRCFDGMHGELHVLEILQPETVRNWLQRLVKAST